MSEEPEPDRLIGFVTRDNWFTKSVLPKADLALNFAVVLPVVAGVWLLTAGAWVAGLGELLLAGFMLAVILTGRKRQRELEAYFTELNGRIDLLRREQG